MRLFPLFLVLVLIAPACGRKKQPPPPPAPVVQAPVEVSRKAPPGVPQALKDLVDREWPSVLKDGDAFLAKFKEFQNTQGGRDRDAMDPLIDEAKENYEAALEKWADVNNWVQDREDDHSLDSATIEKCREFLAPYEKQVKEWGSKAKVMKEFSRNK